MEQKNVPIYYLNVELLWFVKVKCCVDVLHNVYWACIIEPTWSEGPGFLVEGKENLLVEWILLHFYKSKAFIKILKGSVGNSRIPLQASHVHTEYCRSREKMRVCPVSCFGLCPTILKINVWWADLLTDYKEFSVCRHHKNVIFLKRHQLFLSLSVPTLINKMNKTNKMYCIHQCRYSGSLFSHFPDLNSSF